MYKVSEVAEMLSVEKVKIFEALIVNADLLSPYVTKERHISYIDAKGVKKIENILFGIEEVIEVAEEVITENAEDPTIEDIKDDEFDNNDLNYIINECEEKKSKYKLDIIDLKRKINMLDNELRHKDDAIVNYQNIFKEDLVWLMNQEFKLDNLRLGLLKNNEDELKKSNFLDKFKR